MIEIKKLRRTCSACPSQWEGWTDDGRPVYIRYRWGRLAVRVGPRGGTMEDAVLAEPLVALVVGDPLDGLLDYPELVKLLEPQGLKLPEEEVEDDGT